MKLSLYTDGASRGNPGPAAFAVVLCSEDGRTIKKFARYIGNTTCNEAEYRGLIEGMTLAKEAGASDLQVTSDSELMIKQMNGIYSVRAANLRPLHEQARSLAKQFKSVIFSHVHREHPMIKIADSLANEELDIMKSLRPHGVKNP